MRAEPPNPRSNALAFVHASLCADFGTWCQRAAGGKAPPAPKGKSAHANLANAPDSCKDRVPDPFRLFRASRQLQIRVPEKSHGTNSGQARSGAG
jgi:hypothetical protein